MSGSAQRRLRSNRNWCGRRRDEKSDISHPSRSLSGKHKEGGGEFIIVANDREFFSSRRGRAHMYAVGLRCATAVAAALSKSNFFTVYTLNSSRRLSVSTFDDSAGKMAMVFFSSYERRFPCCVYYAYSSCTLYSSLHERGAATYMVYRRTQLPLFLSPPGNI